MLLQGGSYETSLYAAFSQFGSGMIKLLPDVPTVVVFLHLAALTVLLIHVAVTQLRRFALLRQSHELPSTTWFSIFPPMTASS